MKYYNAESYEVNRFNDAIVKYQVRSAQPRGRSQTSQAPVGMMELTMGLS